MTYEDEERLSAFNQERKSENDALIFLDSLLCEDEKYWVAEWLIRHGGSFAKGIGIALAHADMSNTRKIKHQWPDLWEKALSFTEERKKNNDYY